MRWMIDLAGMILLTSATGSVVLLLWYGVCRLLEREGFYNILYPMLKFVILFFLIPVIYSWFAWSTWNIGNFGGRLFVPTKTLLNWSQGFLTVWVIGVICVSGYYLYAWVCFKRQIQKAVSAGPEKRRIFEAVCQEMKIKPEQIQVCEHHGMAIPFLTGIFRPKVIVPVQMKDEDELRVVFWHELMHSRQNDLIWKRMIILIQITQWFNPCVWWLLGLYNRWCEYACDTEVSRKMRPLSIYRLRQNLWSI